MTTQDQMNLIEYGKSIDIKVTPMVIDGEPGVAYCDWGYTVKAEVAHRDLLFLTYQTEKCGNAY